MLKFAHVALVCRDPLRVERFYAKHFGFERQRVIPVGESDQVVFTSAAGLTLEIFSTQEERPLPPPDKDGYPFQGLRHIAFQVDDVDAKLEQMGSDANISLGPLDFGDVIPGWRTVWIRDPEGNIVEISQGYRPQESPAPLEESAGVRSR